MDLMNRDWVAFLELFLNQKQELDVQRVENWKLHERIHFLQN